VLKKDIDHCRFIGSPLSLLYMMNRRHPFGRDKKRFEKCTILVARQLEVVYDVYKPLKEICNNAIKVIIACVEFFARRYLIFLILSTFLFHIASFFTDIKVLV
jgi:hypothetical protein